MSVCTTDRWSCPTCPKVSLRGRGISDSAWTRILARIQRDHRARCRGVRR